MLHEDKFDTAISIVAHDLRGIVNNFYEIFEYLIENPQEPDIILRGKKQALDAVQFLTEICEWAREKNLKPEFSSFNPAVRLLSVLNNREALEKKKVSISIKGDSGEIYSERRIFDIVARNIISNAVKFTPIGGSISIFFERFFGTVVFTVKNDVEKCPDPETLNAFFDISRKHERGTGGERGTGIGLALVKNFCDMLGWGTEVSCTEKSISVSFFIHA